MFSDVWHDVNYVENEVLNITGKTLRGIIIENMPPPPKKKKNQYKQNKQTKQRTQCSFKD